METIYDYMMQTNNLSSNSMEVVKLNTNNP